MIDFTVEPNCFMKRLKASFMASLFLEQEFGMASTTVLKWAHGAQKQMIGDTIYTNNNIKKENDILKRAAVLLAKT